MGSLSSGSGAFPNAVIPWIMPIAFRLFPMKYVARRCKTFKPLIAFSFCSEECSPQLAR